MNCKQNQMCRTAEVEGRCLLVEEEATRHSGSRPKHFYRDLKKKKCHFVLVTELNGWAAELSEDVGDAVVGFLYL